MLKSPLFSAGLALVVIWALWVGDFYPHFVEMQIFSSEGTQLNQWQKPAMSIVTEVHQEETYSTITPQPEQDNTTIPTDRPLILYAFFETGISKPNFEFFLKHALHDAADFLFVINGDTELDKLIPVRPNIKYVRRQNNCYDMGAFAEVLLKDDLYKRYNRFITMNGSIRGPFIPTWSNSCWSDVFLNKVTDKVKLVGMSLGCRPLPHVQSMIWATDRIGMEILLHPSEEVKAKFFAELPDYENTTPVPSPEVAGIVSCPNEYWKAVAIEVFATPLIRAAGYDVDVLMTAYHSIPDYEQACWNQLDGDMLFAGHYWGMNIHPFDTLFAKTNRDNDPVVLEKLTQWTGDRQYSSYDYCH